MTILFVLSVATLLLVVHAIWVMAKPTPAPLHKLTALEARVSNNITTYNTNTTTYNTRFTSLEERLSVVEELGSIENVPSQQSDGSYRTNESGERVSESPPVIAKPFVSGQTVDVRFMDDAEPEDKPLLRFSAIYVRFSKDTNGMTQVWLRCDEEDPKPYALEDVLLRHPGEAR